MATGEFRRLTPRADEPPNPDDSPVLYPQGEHDASLSWTKRDIQNKNMACGGWLSSLRDNWGGKQMQKTFSLFWEASWVRQLGAARNIFGGPVDSIITWWLFVYSFWVFDEYGGAQDQNFEPRSIYWEFSKASILPPSSRKLLSTWLSGNFSFSNSVINANGFLSIVNSFAWIFYLI